MIDATNPPASRPEGEEFWRLSEILLRLDAAAETGGAAAFEAAIVAIVPIDVLTYVAQQRALRADLILRQRGLRIDKAVFDAIAAAWIDGAIMMATYEREREKQDKA